MTEERRKLLIKDRAPQRPRCQVCGREEVMKYTPGPWKVASDDDGGFQIDHRHGPDEDMPGCVGTLAEVYGETNAHIISAAPEMYEALQAIIKENAIVSKKTVELIYKAISKAEGRTP